MDERKGLKQPITAAVIIIPAHRTFVIVPSNHEVVKFQLPSIKLMDKIIAINKIDGYNNCQ